MCFIFWPQVSFEGEGRGSSVWPQDKALWGSGSYNSIHGLWIQDQACPGFEIGVPKATVCLFQGQRCLKGWVGTRAGWAGQCWISAWEVETYVCVAGDPEGEPASVPYLEPVDPEWHLNPARNISLVNQETSKNPRTSKNRAAWG